MIRAQATPSFLKRWFQRCGALLCLAAVFFASGLFAFSLQSVGWAKMYAAYRTALPVSESLQLTFSGEEICGICVLSEDALQDLEENLELGLQNMKTPLAQACTEPVILSPQPPTQRDYETLCLLPILEISNGIEPPPPRLA